MGTNLSWKCKLLKRAVQVKEEVSKAVFRRLKEVVCKFRKFHRKAFLLESHFNKVAGLKIWNFIKNRLQQRCFNTFFHRTAPMAPSQV